MGAIGDRAAGGLTRRSFVRHAAAGSAALALGGATPGWARRRPRPFRGGRFSSGVIAGFPGLDSIRLWTRLADVDGPGSIGVEIARDPDFRRVVHAQEALVRPGADHTAHIAVRSARLRPGEQYHYRFHTSQRSSRVGRFRTRRPFDSREPVRIGYFSCQGWQPGYFTAHAGLADEDLDLAVSLGDYIYELTDDDGPRTDPIGPAGDGEAQTLREYRQKYHLYQGDRNLQAMHAAHAFVCVWDDHETESGGKGPRHPGDTQGRERRVPYRRRRLNGMRAFFEHLPVPRFDGDPSRVYRAIPISRNAELLLIDLNQYGDYYVCGFQVPPQPCLEAEDPSLSFLGRRQKRWLKRRLAHSRAAWKVIGNPKMMMSLDLAPGLSFNPGQWDGFVAERRELMQHILRRDIDGVTVITGDIHTFFAGQVTTTGRATGRAAATEFVGGSITSEGIAQGVAEAMGLPENSPIVPLVTQRLEQNNPHYEFVDTEHRGYGVLEARPDELRVTFRSPRTVLEPRSEVRTLAEFRVPRGSPRVERLR
jgi:alkaline phosphatase D